MIQNGNCSVAGQSCGETAPRADAQIPRCCSNPFSNQRRATVNRFGSTAESLRVGRFLVPQVLSRLEQNLVRHSNLNASKALRGG